MSQLPAISTRAFKSNTDRFLQYVDYKSKVKDITPYCWTFETFCNVCDHVIHIEDFEYISDLYTEC